MLREYAIEWWFIIPPLLTNVSALPRETWTRKLSFKYATGMCLLLENVGGSEQNRSVANVQSDDLWPSHMHAATHILQQPGEQMNTEQRCHWRRGETVKRLVQQYCDLEINSTLVSATYRKTSLQALWNSLTLPQLFDALFPMMQWPMSCTLTV